MRTIAHRRQGNTLLHKAVEYGYAELAVFILHHFPGAKHAKARDGATPLHRAAATGHVSHLDVRV
jgi:hypothetical protein